MPACRLRGTRAKHRKGGLPMSEISVSRAEQFKNQLLESAARGELSENDLVELSAYLYAFVQAHSNDEDEICARHGELINRFEAVLRAPN